MAPHRFYGQYRLTEEFEGKEVTVRLNAVEGDKGRKLNRAEVLRPIPWSDEDFDTLYNRRSDTESTNRTLENTLYWQRAHSVGHVRQEVDWLGFGILENALTAVRHRERERLKA